MKMCHSGPKMGLFAQKKFFFSEKTLFLSFIPMYIPKIKFRYQSITDILTIKEYWNLIG